MQRIDLKEDYYYALILVQSFPFKYEYYKPEGRWESDVVAEALLYAKRKSESRYLWQALAWARSVIEEHEGEQVFVR